MGIPRGLIRLSYAACTMEAWSDWRRLAQDATAHGHGDLVAQFQPPEGAGYKKVDQAAARLKAAMRARKT